ncbi:hypothetical protein E2493_13475 [Sphingomonas parva]|uniref:DUF6265 domain-containing protein n=1 Tax=Sphingomonas parva TaxID=2555898 RepID=A0A4Y8ZP24_9SPHN|nr:hypothetical protein E2493_13475 [Sphingomonas parva]
MFAAGLAAALAAPGEPPDLGWMAGSWVSEGPSRWTEERWSRPRGGVMLGTGLSGEGARAESFEFMRIAPDDQGRLTFWGSPEGATPTPFRYEGGGEREAVFVNPSHDYPQRIVYRREGAELVATISLADGSKPQTWRYVRKWPADRKRP